MSQNKKKEIQIYTLKKLMNSCDDNVRSLLKSAEILHPTHPQIAISLTIIALEETYKLSKISTFIKNRKNMNEKNWEDISSPKSHRKKLRGFFQDGIDEYKKIDPNAYVEFVKQWNKISERNYKESYDHVISDANDIFEKLGKLQDIKLHSLYRGWNFDQEKITDITLIYNFKELQILSTYLFDLVNHLFLDVLLHHKYLANFHITIPKEQNIMLQDELWKFLDDYYKKIKESNYSKIINIGKVMLETFPDKLPEKYIPKKKRSRNKTK